VVSGTQKEERALFGGKIGIGELLAVLALVVLIFGVGRIGRIGKELGTGIAEFRKGLKEGEEEATAEETEEGES
jgi:sec-independent protein translocase protein TatA